MTGPGVSQPGDCLWVKKTSLELNVSSVVPPVSQEKCFRSGKGRGKTCKICLATPQSLHSDRLFLLVNLRSLARRRGFAVSTWQWWLVTTRRRRLCASEPRKMFYTDLCLLKIKQEFAFFTSKLKILFFVFFMVKLFSDNIFSLFSTFAHRLYLYKYVNDWKH